MISSETLFIITLIFYLITVTTFAAILIRHATFLALRSVRLKRQKVFAAAVDAALFDQSTNAVPTVTPLDLKYPFDRHVLENLLIRRFFIFKGNLGRLLAEFFKNSGLTDRHVKRLTSPFKWQRRRSADILGDIQSRIQVPSLIIALRDPDEDVRAIAAKSLGELRAVSTIEFIVSLFEDLDDTRCYKVADTLIAFGEDAVPALARQIGHDDVKVRYWTTRCLQLIKPSGPLPDYEKAAERIAERVRVEQHRSVRRVIPKVISNSGRKDLLPSLEVLSRDEDVPTREKAAESMGQLRNEAAIPVLIGMLDDKDWDVRYAASRAMFEFEERGLDDVEKALPSLSKVASEWAREMLVMKGRIKTA